MSSRSASADSPWDGWQDAPEDNAQLLAYLDWLIEHEADEPEEADRVYDSVTV